MEMTIGSRYGESHWPNLVSSRARFTNENACACYIHIALHRFLSSGRELPSGLGIQPETPPLDNPSLSTRGQDATASAWFVAKR